jgi:hypothetical protein
VARAIGGAVAVAMVTAMLIGCVKQATLPDDCSATSVQREATLTGERLNPEAINVCKGQQLTLTIITQRAGEIHIHGYEKEMEVEPGDTATFTFSTTLPGQFHIELHTPNNGPEIEIGILTVNEP